MSLERLPPPTPAEMPSPCGLAPGDVTAAMRLQILSTEHWSLLATRSLAWSEAFARAGMFLSLLSGTLVALALVGDGSRFGDAFLVFGVAILPVVLFVGVATHLRLAASNYLDAQCVIGMNRIRSAYVEFAPDLSPYFVTGTRDDRDAVARTMAVPPGMSPIVHVLAATPSLVSVVNAVLAGTIVGFVGLLLRLPEAGVLAMAALAFGAAFIAGMAFGRSRLRAIQSSLPSLEPPAAPG